MFSMDFLYSIRFRLLASLFVLLGLSISVSMYELWTFERDRSMSIVQKEAMYAGQTIEKVLRSAMLQNNWAAIQQSVDDIHAIAKTSVISILSFEGTVALSSDPSMAGLHFDRDSDDSCVACHTTKAILPQRTAVFFETADGPMLRNVLKIPNGPECYGCHAPSQKNCGILIYDVSFADTITMLRTVMFRMALTGLVAFVFLILVLSFIIQRYVHRPLHQLMDGFIHVGSGDFNHWVGVDTRGEFQQMADQFNVMSRAIQRSFVEIRGKNWETSCLYTFVQQLSRAIEWKELRRLITDLLYESFNAQAVIVCLSREKQGQIVYEVSWRQADDRRYYHLEYALQVESNDLPFDIASELEKWRAGELTAPCFNENDTMVFLPLNDSPNIPLGWMCLQREASLHFSRSEKKLILAVGEQVGIALANARLYRMAITDGLTELYTRRYCETAMRKFLAAYESAPENDFCVMLLDIDHFKRVNDTHGHQVGDDVLVEIAGLIRSNIRDGDVACRYGGEEFLVLMAGGVTAARESAQRLRQIIEEHVFSSSIAPELRLRNNISIGVANFPLHGRTGDEVVGAADQALYKAKVQGRNRVVCFGDGAD